MFRTRLSTAKLWHSTIKAVRPFRRCKPSDMDSERQPIVLYAFELLRPNGKDLLDLPIEEGKGKLAELFAETPAALRYSISFTKDIEELLGKARTLGLEGLIGKRSNSRYEAGKRSGAWIKIKLHLEQEFVIGRYTEPAGQSRA
jgi:bifunctional non-homologous end joining protein LigD